KSPSRFINTVQVSMGGTPPPGEQANVVLCRWTCQAPILRASDSLETTQLTRVPMKTCSPPARVVFLFLASVATITSVSGQSPAGGSAVDDIINLKRVGSPAISPNGQLAAYTVRETNWDENAYETEIWLGDGNGPARQVTSARKSSSQPAFS